MIYWAKKNIKMKLRKRSFRKFGLEVTAENMKYMFIHHGNNAGKGPNI